MLNDNTVAPTAPENKTEGVFISTYGCQMNVNDTERMYSLLEMMNYEPVERPEDASLIIINSCSVREKPVHKVHSEVGRYRKMKQLNPRLKIGVGGCVAQQEKTKLLKDLPILDFVFGTDAIDKLPGIVQDLKSADKKRVASTQFLHGEPYQIETMVRNPGVATFVNITKGCDNFCTFCVVPFTRGRERSRALKEIVADIHKLTARGVKEVTLLGQNVNSYGSDCGANFAVLLKRLAVETDLQRIRYTTPHPKDFDEDVADVIAEHRDKIMEYIHLPAQSGNSEILERMNRGYTREEYIAKAKMLQTRVPGAVFSSDIIVGFPGETEAQFQDTMTLLDEVPYESIFAFKYSPRPNTKAAKFGDQIEEDVKSDRLNRLFAKHKVMAADFAKRYQGETIKVLVEEYHESDDFCFGRSTQNKSVHFDGTKDLVGRIVSVKINETSPQVLYGEYVP